MRRPAIELRLRRDDDVAGFDSRVRLVLAGMSDGDHQTRLVIDFLGVRDIRIGRLEHTFGLFVEILAIRKRQFGGPALPCCRNGE
jgi:hypothetical protein